MVFQFDSGSILMKWLCKKNERVSEPERAMVTSAPQCPHQKKLFSNRFILEPFFGHLSEAFCFRVCVSASVRAFALLSFTNVRRCRCPRSLFQWREIAFSENSTTDNRSHADLRRWPYCFTLLAL